MNEMNKIIYEAIMIYISSLSSQVLLRSLLETLCFIMDDFLHRRAQYHVGYYRCQCNNDLLYVYVSYYNGIRFTR